MLLEAPQNIQEFLLIEVGEYHRYEFFVVEVRIAFGKHDFADAEKLDKRTAGKSFERHYGMAKFIRSPARGDSTEVIVFAGIGRRIIHISLMTRLRAAYFFLFSPFFPLSAFSFCSFSRFFCSLNSFDFLPSSTMPGSVI